METKKYMAGNWLRQFFSGEFESIEEAWSFLSKRFMISYPCDTDGINGSRYIYMFVKEKNKYNIEEWVLCKESQLSEKNDLKKELVLERCKCEGSKAM